MVWSREKLVADCVLRKLGESARVKLWIENHTEV
jgi:hypothetical protein